VAQFRHAFSGIVIRLIHISTVAYCGRAQHDHDVEL